MTQWDPVCGVPTMQAGFIGSLALTPTTGEVTAYSCNDLCRLWLIILPGGPTVTKDYGNLGNSTTQYFRTLTRKPAG